MQRAAKQQARRTGWASPLDQAGKDYDEKTTGHESTIREGMNVVGHFRSFVGGHCDQEFLEDVG